MTDPRYVHGYSDREAARLADQAATLTTLLHHDSVFPDRSLIFEPGCGTGAQTIILASLNPASQIHAMDISNQSLDEAEQKVKNQGFTNVSFKQGDIMHLNYPDAKFDHVFVCFVLEHLPDPEEALKNLIRVVKPGGTVMVIEGDHGSVFFAPHNDLAMQVINCQIELQRIGGGDACIGRRLYPILSSAGLKEVSVSPRVVYVDASRPDLIEGFTKLTFTSMIEGVRDAALAAGLMSRNNFDEGVKGLYRTCEPDGMFCYMFFKAIGKRSIEVCPLP